jgi:polar amino acid transport system substrate-binding protein
MVEQYGGKGSPTGGRDLMRVSVAVFMLMTAFAFAALPGPVPEAGAESLVIAFSYDIPPFVMDGGTRGLEIDIVREALGRKGHAFTTVQCSYGRLEKAVLQMRVDAAAGVRERDDGSHYSDFFISFRNYAISRKNSGLTIQRVSDLAGKTVYTWQNAHRDLGAEFASLFSPGTPLPAGTDYLEVPVQEKQVELFWTGRANAVVVIDEAIFKWFTRRMQDRVNTGADLVYHDIFDRTTEFQVGFRDRRLKDEFNQGLREIRESGLYGKLVEAYR